MIFKLWRYAYAGAKVMALKSYLLTAADYHYLLRARNLEDLLGYLRTTACGPVLAGWDWRRADAEAELSRRLYRDLAFAPDVAAMVAHLPTETYVKLLQGAGDIAAVEERLRQYWLQVLEKVLVQPPFQIGVPVNYLFLKELELDNLITLITGMYLKVPSERLAPLLRRRPAGAPHV
jgi:vacuolar-type H+-ATPase subunit C/Vma6